jgi:ubiquinone/menaquinone biosynthesis C-methylase UbiE
MAMFDNVMRNKERVCDTIYRDPAKLDARGALQPRFGVNPLPIQEWELGLVDLSGVQQALDAGCGNGDSLLLLARRLASHGATVIGLDLAEGSLGEARARARAAGVSVECMLGDIEALPFDDRSFDLVLANWVLYHVPDLDRAIAELRRVLRPGGTLLAATNGQHHMSELWRLMEQVLTRVGASPQRATEVVERGRAASALSFRLENGAQRLRRCFSDVRLERYLDELRVTEAEPLVAYLGSLWFVERMLAGAATEHEHPLPCAQVTDSVRAVVQEWLAADGVVRISKATGAFVAR